MRIHSAQIRSFRVPETFFLTKALFWRTWPGDAFLDSTFWAFGRKKKLRKSSEKLVNVKFGVYTLLFAFSVNCVTCSDRNSART
jgi:hypothetical protein